MIYLVEDDNSIRELVIYTLQSTGFEARGFACGADFWEGMKEDMPELVLLDIMLPDEDGLSILRKLRGTAATQKLPVMMLTAKGTEYDKVIGLDSGADDYLPKPFELEELDARLRALLRRSEGRTQERQRLGELEYDDEGFFLLRDEPLSLTPRELSLLKVLMHRRTRPVSRQQLFDQVFSLNDDVSPESIDLYIHRLRKKLSGSGVRVTTLRGLGYVLECGDEVG